MCLFHKKIHFKIKIIILKHKVILFSSLCIFSVLSILFVSFHLKISLSDPEQFSSNPSEPLVYTCCTPLNNSLRTNVYFLKTHKTGSSTVKNVITRFALMNSLDIMDINYRLNYLPFSDFSILSYAKTPNSKYHILAEHVKYASILKSYQYPDTSTVTILRHPVTQFQSVYQYASLNVTTGMNLEQFLNAPQKPSFFVGLGGHFVYRGYNQMSVDLGFDIIQSKNKIAIAEFIEKIDREFDFVMIMEHMEASMVLLANLMGWPLEKVAYLKLNARVTDSDTYELTERDEITIMELNEVDTLLYDHFMNKFLKCLQQYGEQKMRDQIQRLKIINDQFAQRCVKEQIKKSMWFGAPETVEYKLKNLSDLECVYSTASIFELDEIIKNTQLQRFQRLGKA